jgi:hypothetical protein
MSGWALTAVPFSDELWSWVPVRVAANGRFEVLCGRCGNEFWLSIVELESWRVCPHCVGWWCFTGENAVGSEAGNRGEVGDGGAGAEGQGDHGAAVGGAARGDREGR